MQTTKKKRIRRAKHSHSFIKSYFEKAGCELLTENYTGCKQPLKYRCKCGLISSTCYNNFSRGYRCGKCYIAKCQGQAKNHLKRLVLREKLYTMAEAAIWLGVYYQDFYNEVQVTNRLPKPTHIIEGKKRPHYKVEDLEKIKEMIL
jgi:hypothetical protein